MFICKLPPETSIGLLFDDFEDEDDNLEDIVVVVLDTGKVMDLIDRVFGPFNPRQERLVYIERMLSSSFFVLPVIAFNGATIQVRDGRHRTLAMWMRFEKMIPFLTTREMAAVICRGIGSLDPVSKFDFSEIGYPVYIPE